MSLNQKGQFTEDVGNTIALIILIAIGAFVTYSVIGGFSDETDIKATTLENSGTASVKSDIAVDEATASVDYDMDNTGDNYTLILNGENVVELSGIGSGTKEVTVTDTTERGTNNLEAVAESAGVGDSENATLNMTSYAGSSISSVEEKGATSFNLMTILVIVVIASVIIGVVLRSLAGGGGAATSPAPAY